MRRHRLLARATRARGLSAVLAPQIKFRVARHTAELGGLQKKIRIAIVSDLHFGFARSGADRARRVRARVMATAPDMIVFLGDIAGGLPGTDRSPRVDTGCRALQGYAAPLGCYAILGNHDWSDDATARRNRAGPNRAVGMLEDAGWQVLENAAVPLVGQGEGVWLAGVSSQQAFRRWPPGLGGYDGLHDLNQALCDVPSDAPVILLAHEPDIFLDLPDRALLVLSGHMHGGQIRLFGRSLAAPSRYGTQFAYGKFVRAEKTLIVSGGLGCSIVPVRIGVVPEVTVVELGG